MKKLTSSSVSFLTVLRLLAALYIVAYCSVGLFHSPKPKVEFKTQVESDLIDQGGELPEVVVSAQRSLVRGAS